MCISLLTDGGAIPRAAGSKVGGFACFCIDRLYPLVGDWRDVKWFITRTFGPDGSDPSNEGGGRLIVSLFRIRVMPQLLEVGR